MKISVSILNSKDRKEDIIALNKTEISYFHIDVMDGNFVSQKAFSSDEIVKLSTISEKPLDIHLMVDNPLLYIEALKNIPNIENITIHFEIDKDINSILTRIKELGFKRGLSIKPNTKIEDIIPYIDNVDLILLMTVEPGLGGQKILPQSKERLLKLKNLVENRNITIEVDGGINNETIKDISQADIFVVGSYITQSQNPIEKIKTLLV